MSAPPTLIRGHLTMVGVIFCCHRWEVPLPFSKLKPRILLDILLRTGQPPPQRPIWPKMPTVLQERNSTQILKSQTFPGSCHNTLNSQAHLTGGLLPVPSLWCALSDVVLCFFGIIPLSRIPVREFLFMHMIFCVCKS